MASSSAGQWVGVLALCAHAACFEPTPVAGLPCSSEGRCPEGQICDVDNVCRVPGTGSDAAIPDPVDATPLPDAEFPVQIGPEVRITNASGNSNDSDIIGGGSLFGLAWFDARPGAGLSAYGAVVDENGGKVVAEEPLSPDNAVGAHPRGTFNGQKVGVAWAQLGTDGALQIMFSTYNVDLLALTSPVRISTDSMQLADEPAIASSPTEFGLVWRDNRAGLEDVFFLAVNDDGQALGPEANLSNTNTVGEVFADIAAAAGVWGVVWVDRNKALKFTQVTTSGQMTGFPKQLSDDATGHPVIIRANGKWLIAWQEVVANQLVVARFADDGAEERRTIVALGSVPQDPSIAFSGTDLGVVWAIKGPLGGSVIQFARLNASGDIVETNVEITSSDIESSSEPSIDWAQTRWGISWTDNRHGDDEIYFATAKPR